MGLFDAFSSSGGNKAANQAFRAQKKGFNQGLDYAEDKTSEGLGYLDAGVDKAAGYLNQSIAPFQGLYDRGTQGIDAYTALLQNPDSVFDSELYKSRENAGIEGINRLANSRGMLASGNNTQDILDYMRQGGLDYFNTLINAHNPYFGLAQGGATGLGGAYSNLGGLYDQLGVNKANLTQNLGQIGYGAKTGIGQAGADMAMNKYNADQAASGNLWGAILGLGQAAIGAI